jgi:hypothetical protein
MRRTLLLGSVGAALLPLLAGCTDESPLLGPDRFPPGTAPVTLEVALPASAYLEELGRFTGYTGPANATFFLVANAYEGALHAHTLATFTGFPETVTYPLGGESQTDTAFSYGPGRLVVLVDSLGTLEQAAELEVWEVTQSWDTRSVTWTLAADTAGVQEPWQQPGGTRGARVATASYDPDPAARDSVVFELDAATMQRLAGAELEGLLVRPSTPGARLRLRGMALRAELIPDARPDTSISANLSAAPTFVFTPEPPQPATAWHAGGIRGARTLFRIDNDLQLPGCPATQTCPTVSIRDVNLNRIALRLRPVPVPQGHGPLAPVPLAIRTIDEPELGRFAPLATPVMDGGLPAVEYTPGDTLVDLPLTQYLELTLTRDELPLTFALLSASLTERPGAPANFGVAWFAEPELFVTYTLTARARLP